MVYIQAFLLWPWMHSLCSKATFRPNPEAELGATLGLEEVVEPELSMGFFVPICKKSIYCVTLKQCLAQDERKNRFAPPAPGCIAFRLRFNADQAGR
ncbi:MAG: hypothetical protein ACM3JK_02060 [Betaproteobacteria bacterium]